MQTIGVVCLLLALGIAVGLALRRESRRYPRNERHGSRLPERFFDGLK